MEQPAVEDIAGAMTRLHAQAAEDLAGYLRSLPTEAWEGPTACTEWTVRQLAVHVAGGNIRYAGIAHRALDRPSETRTNNGRAGAQPLDLDSLPGDQLVDTLVANAHDFQKMVGRATSDQLQQMAQLPFGSFPLWSVAAIVAIENVIHNWDARVGSESQARIPVSWSVPVARAMLGWAPTLASGDKAGAEGTYLFEVGDGVGPVTLQVRSDGITITPGRTDDPDVVLHLTSDQYIRLLWGRLKVHQAVQAGDLRTDGDPSQAAQLNKVFAGIGN